MRRNGKKMSTPQFFHLANPTYLFCRPQTLPDIFLFVVSIPPPQHIKWTSPLHKCHIQESLGDSCHIMPMMLIKCFFILRSAVIIIKERDVNLDIVNNFLVHITMYRRKRPYGFIHWKMTMWVLHNRPYGCKMEGNESQEHMHSFRTHIVIFSMMNP